MPRLTDLDAVRRILETDRLWSAFALADLIPGYREHAEWYTAAGADDALVLVYRAFDPPLFVTVGDASRLEPIISELAGEPAFYLSVKEALLEPIVEAGYRLERRRLMRRMALDLERYSPSRAVATRPLGPDDLHAVEALYREGLPRGEQPEFFLPDMLGTGVYEGVWEGDGLVACGGTLVYAPSENVAALGNIYVRRDRRGQGLGAAVTSATVDRIRDAGVSTIVLNVVADNAAAVRVYHRLGFTTYCDFIEAFARR